jgi:hypothetical protein
MPSLLSKPIVRQDHNKCNPLKAVNELMGYFAYESKRLVIEPTRRPCRRAEPRYLALSDGPLARRCGDGAAMKSHGLTHPSEVPSASWTPAASSSGSSISVEQGSRHVLNTSSEQALDKAFASLAKLRADALDVTGEPFFDSQRERIVALSARYRIAGCYPWREYVLAGGLMSYGTNLPDWYRQAGTYVGRVLKGEKPADLPVMQPKNFELVINLMRGIDVSFGTYCLAGVLLSLIFGAWWLG